MRAAGLTLKIALVSLVAAAPAVAAPGDTPYRVVAFGDSYGSGEGAPGTAGSYNENGAGGTVADWSGTSQFEAFTGDVETGTNGARRCHRSPKATAAAATKTLAAEFANLDISFRSFACSGARIDFGIVGPYKGAEPIDEANPVPSQISRANAYLQTLPSSSRRIDTLVMNIGGNNLGFGDIIAACVSLPYGSPPNVAINDCNPEAEAILTTGDRQQAPERAGLDDLPAVYRDLDDRIDRRITNGGTELAARPGKVFLTGAPDPLAGNFDACASLNGPNDYEQKLSETERTYLHNSVFPRVNGAYQSAATANGWTLVSLSPGVTTGACSTPEGDRQINRNRDALRTQGATINSSAGINISHGIFHPNPAGYAGMSPLLANQMRTEIVRRFTPGSAPTGAAPGPVVELKPRVEVDVPQPTALDYPTRPAAVLTPLLQTGFTTGPIGAARVELALPGSIGNTTTLRASRCGPVTSGAFPARGCGPITGEITAFTGIPASPTSVSSAPDPLGVKVTFTKASTVPLRRFLIEATTDLGFSRGGRPRPRAGGTEPGAGPGPPAGGFLKDEVSRVVTQQFSFDASNSSRFEPTSRSNVVQKVLPLGAGKEFSIKVRECTDRGCSAGRSTGSVKASGDAGANDLTRSLIKQMRQEDPVGIFSLRTNLRPTAGRQFPILLSWGTWTRWTDLRQLTLRFRGPTGLLAEARLNMRSRRITLAAPGRRGVTARLGSRRSLRAGPLTLDLRGARIVSGGPGAASSPCACPSGSRPRCAASESTWRSAPPSTTQDPGTGLGGLAGGALNVNRLPARGRARAPHRASAR